MFFVPVVNVRALTQTEYGYYRQFWLLFETLTPLLILGFPRSLMYYFPRSESHEEKSIYVTQTIAYLAGASVVAVLIYAGMGYFLGSGMGAMVRGFFWRLCAFTVCMIVSWFMDELFVAEKQVERQSVYHFITASIQAVVVILVSWRTRDVNQIIWALAWLAAAKAAFALIYAKVVYRPAFRKASLSTIREQFSFALPLGMVATALLLLTKIDQFIINSFLGREALAVYAMGAFQLPFVHIIAGSVANVTFPLMAQYQKEGRFADFATLWRRAWLKTAVLFFPIFIFLFATADQFIQILFTGEYAGAAPVFRIYLVLLLMATTDYAGVLTAFKKQGYLFKVMVVAVAGHIVTGVVLFKIFGRLGIPVSTVTWFYVVATLSVRKGAGLLGRSFWKTLPWRSLSTRMFVAAVPGVPLYLLYARHGDFSIWRYGVAGAVYFAAYFALCWATRLLTRDDIKSLFGKKPVVQGGGD
jgi:O-antigen/teichoic acid export membrane protein